MYEWTQTVLFPWFTWANTHPDGPCNTYVTYEDNYTVVLRYRTLNY